MHILVIPTAYPSVPRPTSGIFFKEQVTALRRAGYTVGVLVAPRIIETWQLMKQTKHLPPLMAQEGKQDYRLHWGWFPRVFPLITAYLHQLVALRAFKIYCDKHGKPDIIHAHNIFYSGYIASIIGKQYKIPTIITEHSSNFLTGRIFLPTQHIIAHRTLKQIDYVIAVSKPLANKINQDYEHGISIIPNMVNTDFFRPVINSSEKFIVTCVANLIPLKQIANLITAFAHVFKDDESILLKIGGSGSELPKLQALVKSLQIDSQVEFLGQLTRTEVRDLFQQSDVVVSASHTETFGVTLVEAMSCGKPVIATRSGGPETFVTEETGILIPVNDIDALAEALQKMQRDIANFDADTIRAYAVKYFSEKAIVEQLSRVYQELITTV